MDLAAVSQALAQGKRAFLTRGSTSLQPLSGPFTAPVPASRPKSGVQAGQHRKVVVHDGKYNAFPGLVYLAGGRHPGRIIGVYRNGTSHISADSAHNLCVSDDGGNTWTATLLQSGTSALDLRDPILSLLSNGDILLTYFKYDIADSVSTGMFQRRSSDGGDTWSVEAAVPNFFTKADVRATGRIVETSAGHLLLPAYGYTTVVGGDPTSAALLVSSDNGVTWASQVVVANGPVDTRSYNEMAVQKLSDGRLLALIRMGTAGIFQTYSSDNGATWGSASQAWPVSTPGRPEFVASTTGALVCVTRGTRGPQNTVLRYSYDLGATWSAEQQFHSAISMPMQYASLVELSPGVLGCLYAQESAQPSTGSSNLWWRYILDGAGTSPLGDLTPHRAVAVLNEADVLAAYDRPDRADETSLSTSDSTHEWLRWGNVNATIGVASGIITATGSSMGSLGYYALDANSADGEISARISATGNLQGFGFIFRGADFQNYLYIAVQTNGGAIWLQKIVAGVTTTLSQQTITTAEKNAGWLPFRVIFRNNRIKAFLNGEKQFDFTLATGDQTTFGANTKHGMLMSAAGQSMRDFAVRL